MEKNETAAILIPVEEYERLMGIRSLKLDVISASSFHNLPKLSDKYPFDRMIIWQAIKKDYYLLSNNSSFSEYEQFGLKLT